MRFVETPLKDAHLILLEPLLDERGSFCRLFCQELFAKHLLDGRVAQMNESVNVSKGTLRGMHYQLAPHEESKVVYCTRGSIYDVIVDLRENSPTYGHHFGTILEEKTPAALFVPKGFAHGFITLEEDTRLLYLMSEFYKPGCERGFHFDDPAFNINWPIKPAVLSKRDQNYSPFKSLKTCEI